MKNKEDTPNASIPGKPEDRPPSSKPPHGKPADRPPKPKPEVPPRSSGISW